MLLLRAPEMVFLVVSDHSQNNIFPTVKLAKVKTSQYVALLGYVFTAFV
jgi:hypothetical protein